jgi:hypothetical protein
LSATALMNARRSGPRQTLPVARSLTLAFAASLLVIALVAIASVMGLTEAVGDVYDDSASILVSRGAGTALMTNGGLFERSPGYVLETNP